MNTLYFTYALEVEKTASITQAADNLFMSQPTLSKSIKDLESNMGFSIFRRTSRGVIPTEKGQIFLDYAKKIVSLMEKMNTEFQLYDKGNQLFSLAFPRVSYIAEAVSKYLCSFNDCEAMELSIHETSSSRVIESVEDHRSELGIIRYLVDDELLVKQILEEKKLQSRLLQQGWLIVLLNEKHPLAAAESLSCIDLDPFIEVAYEDEAYTALSVKRSLENTGTRSAKQILVNDRATSMDILRQNPGTYLWSSPVSSEVLDALGLVQKEIKNSKAFKDILICRSGYQYSPLDQVFLNEFPR